MAKFIMRSIKRSALEGAEGTRYPHLLKAGDTSTSEIARRISAGSSFTAGDVKGLITALSGALAHEMALGMTVHLEGIGTFRPLLRLREGAEQERVDSESRRNAASVEIGKISFIPDDELLWETSTSADLQRVSALEKEGAKLPRDEREELLLELIRTEGYVTISSYAGHAGISRSTASRELREIAARPDSPISRVGTYSHVRYVARLEEPTE